MYSHLPRSVVEKYVSLCPTCSLRKPQLTKPPLKPIVTNGLFSRVQVNNMSITQEKSLALHSFVSHFRLILLI